MPIRMGEPIRSKRDRKLVGTVVGYGFISWPTSADIYGDNGEMHPVYLVQVAEGSSSEKHACMVMRADQAERLEGKNG